MPDMTITTTAKGWPLLDSENFLEAIPDYTDKLATKLDNADADVAAAINAANRAEAAAATVDDTGWQPLTLLAGYTGSCEWCRVGGTVYLLGRVTRTGGAFPTSGTYAVANVPTGASPYATGYYAAANRAGGGYVVQVGSEYKVRAGFEPTNEVELDSVQYRGNV